MIHNQPAHTDNAHINALRKAFEHRATWFALLVEEAGKRGLDSDFAHAAITRCGCIDGETKYPQTADIKEFAKVFATEDIQGIFEMDVAVGENTLDVTFHYCPLVAAWQRLGYPEEKIADFCQIAMDGDRGIASANPHLEFYLGDTIAAGCDTCVVKFTSKP